MYIKYLLSSSILLAYYYFIMYCKNWQFPYFSLSFCMIYESMWELWLLCILNVQYVTWHDLESKPEWRWGYSE